MIDESAYGTSYTRPVHYTLPSLEGYSRRTQITSLPLEICTILTWIKTDLRDKISISEDIHPLSRPEPNM